MIDKKFIGMKLPAFKAVAEAGQLRFFAKATGQADPVYTDESAAKERGHPGLPVPPTFLFTLELTTPSTAWRDEMGIVPTRMLHGEQWFTYHRTAYAGDTLTFEPCIVDLYDKKGGAMEFIVKETRVTNQRGEHVADLRSVAIHRPPQSK